ncbi:DUF3667 domain-containing protein [Tamlana fucoidanivorans]|uniref:DUF3667 domain-containing protein n=1 Tax=Allotamlana fucoidanivorans TaxID=2583814 RepID=A0A5C4SNB8_9FLAO|nr:DUF3667 domain-containing protein [Tamlana fucoidanivorans]TNJ45661.1 DUF3667 domain-containing protein [Tamlana fucoidanivorans]
MLCFNCKTKLIENAKYCYCCGEKATQERLTLKRLFQLYIQTFLNLDNLFFKTFLSLFYTPEDVINSYIKGIRKKYINVIGYFALALTFTGLELFILNNYFPEFSDLSKTATRETAHLSNQIVKSLQSHQTLVLICLIPIFTGITRLVFRKNKTYNYTELLVAHIYIFAHTTLITVVISIFAALINLSMVNIGWGLLVFKTLYLGFVLKRIYNKSFKSMALKLLSISLLIVIIYYLTIFVTISFIYFVFGETYLENLIHQ